MIKTIKTTHDKPNLTTIQIRKAQNDIGANASLANNKDAIILYNEIKAYAVAGVQTDDPGITCTGKGYLPWQSQSGEHLLVPIYYCAEADGTISLQTASNNYIQRHIRGSTYFVTVIIKRDISNFITAMV